MDKLHPQYNKYEPIWQRVKDFCEGEDAVKARRDEYLPMLPSQNQPIRNVTNLKHKTLYDLFLEKATVWPGAAKTLRAYTGILNRKQPEVIVPEGYEKVFSLAGEDIYTSASWLSKEVMQAGLAGFLVDFPNDSPRPYAVKYRARDILDWKYMVYNGANELIYLTLAEEWSEDGRPDVVVKLALEPIEDTVSYTATKYERTEEKGKEVWKEVGFMVPLMNGSPLEYIPFIPCTEDGALIKYIYPVLLDVTNLNKAHYQNDAEYRNALTFAGRPTPCVSGLIQPDNDQTIQLGTSTVLQFEPGGSWGMLGLDDASGIGAIRQAGQDLQADMAIAGSRALMNDPTGVEAAETASIHREGEHGQLSTIAKVVSECMTKTIEIMAEWQGIPGEFSYRINTDFNPGQVDPQTLNTLWQMYMSGDISFELLWYNMQRGELTPDLRSVEEEKAAALADRTARVPTNTVNLDAIE